MTDMITGTAWWGQCPGCFGYFGTHNTSCPQMAALRSTTAPAAPVTWNIPVTVVEPLPPSSVALSPFATYTVKIGGRP